MAAARAERAAAALYKDGAMLRVPEPQPAAGQSEPEPEALLDFEVQLEPAKTAANDRTVAHAAPEAAAAAGGTANTKVQFAGWPKMRKLTRQFY